jgi:NAD(P)-dependent dehydrogenase (short-subunit alcohol dehydrogenase family)
MALVTGGARGCGLAFAEGLAEAGADVATFDVIEPVEGWHEISKTYGVKTKHYMQCFPATNTRSRPLTATGWM